MAKKTTGTLWWLTEIRECEALDDATDVLLMITLADHVDARDETFVGIETLALGARCSYPTAKRRLAALQERGFIRRERRRRDDGNLSTYTTKMIREALEPGITVIPDKDGLGITQVSHDQGSPRRSLTRDHPDDPAEVPSDEVSSDEVNTLAPSAREDQGSLPVLADPVFHSVQIETEFTEWWQMVPRKIGKGDALKAYRAARRKVPQQVIFDGTVQWVRESKHKELEYIPYPATWLRAERWDDEETPVAKPNRSTGASPIDGLIELKRRRGEL